MPTVLITGANRGIGLEFARQYVADGWRVIAACREPARAQSLLDCLPAADVVPLDRDRLVYRDSGVVLATRAADNPEAKAFARFLASPRGEAIFRKFGWTSSARR